jgi:hypothetical protein
MSKCLTNSGVIGPVAVKPRRWKNAANMTASIDTIVDKGISNLSTLLDEDDSDDACTSTLLPRLVFVVINLLTDFKLKEEEDLTVTDDVIIVVVVDENATPLLLLLTLLMPKHLMCSHVECVVERLFCTNEEETEDGCVL